MILSVTEHNFLKNNAAQVHCHLHLQHIQRNNRICHHPLNAHAQVNKHMSAHLTIAPTIQFEMIIPQTGKESGESL